MGRPRTGVRWIGAQRDTHAHAMFDIAILAASEATLVVRTAWRHQGLSHIVALTQGQLFARQLATLCDSLRSSG